ncbi:hypothetical protein evm_012863 [Chilo suppressalis]|nr:hypothetical protein evm_012863 [Chilo suppressalis]
MGETTIDMTKEFVEARKNFLTDPNNVSYQALKDSFRIFGPDGTETGEIVMFLRISCFGKLIITRFQGGGPPALSAGGGNAIVDRSCNPQREFQTSQEPCACGAARGSAGLGAAVGNEGTMGGGIGGGGGGVCPPARDLYNIMPCQDPDDPCYCTGPKPPPKDPMACRNTDQYCLHIPKGELLKKPYTQEIIKEQKINLMTTMQTDRLFMSEIVLANIKECNERSNIQKQFARLPDYSMQPSESYTVYENISTFAFDSIESNKQSIPLFNTLDYANNSQSDYLNSEHDSFDLENDLFFGTKETAVYMTLYDDLSYNHSLRSRSTAGTQATASINKCLQIQNESDISTRRQNTISSNSCNYSSCTMTTNPYYGNKKIDRMRYSDVYFFGRKRDPPNPEQMEMGKKVKLQRGGQTNSIPIQTNKVTGASTGTSTKTVSIKEDKSCNESTCPAIAQSVKGDMVATVSHIKLGPREPCPVHGKEPCQGPKCIVASSGEEKAPVKVTTVSNPRRGVFELVIRKMTGAPLAKNELMLEWTPPPNQPSCITPCILPCSPTVPSCHPSKSSAVTKFVVSLVGLANQEDLVHHHAVDLARHANLVNNVSLADLVHRHVRYSNDPVDLLPASHVVAVDLVLPVSHHRLASLPLHVGHAGAANLAPRCVVSHAGGAFLVLLHLAEVADLALLRPAGLFRHHPAARVLSAHPAHLYALHLLFVTLHIEDLLIRALHAYHHVQWSARNQGNVKATRESKLIENVYLLVQTGLSAAQWYAAVVFPAFALGAAVYYRVYLKNVARLYLVSRRDVEVAVQHTVHNHIMDTTDDEAAHDCTTAIGDADQGPTPLSACRQTGVHLYLSPLEKANKQLQYVDSATARRDAALTAC